MSKLSDIAYPLSIDEETGNLKLVSGSAVRRQNIESAILTLIGERVMRPPYGSELYLFDVINNLVLIDFKIKQTIERYVPDISCSVKSTINQENELLVEIDWIYLEQSERINSILRYTFIL